MTSEKERMLNGELYDASAPRLVSERERVGAHSPVQSDGSGRTRPATATSRGTFGTIEDDAVVEPPFRCDSGSNVHVGEGFYANLGCVLLDVRRVAFGRNCLLGPGVHVYAATHPLSAEERATGLEYGEPVTVGDDVWIGGRAVLDPGVTVGDGSVIAFGFGRLRGRPRRRGRRRKPGGDRRRTRVTSPSGVQRTRSPTSPSISTPVPRRFPSDPRELGRTGT